jgi:hypothetical protein
VLVRDTKDIKGVDNNNDDEYAMGGTCSTHQRDKKNVKNSGRKI